MWIENVAAADIPVARHHDAGPNSMLIQIADTVKPWFPDASFQFKEVHRLQFLDIEDGDEGVDEHGITNELVQLLQRAFEHRMNVVVNCMAGVCRSGAIVEVGVMMGFIDTEKYRQPNLRVKHKMMQALGVYGVDSK